MPVRDMLESTGMTADVLTRQKVGTTVEGQPKYDYVVTKTNVPCLFEETKGNELVAIAPNVVVAEYEVYLDITESDVTEKNRLRIDGKVHEILLSTNMFNEFMQLKTKTIRQGG